MSDPTDDELDERAGRLLQDALRRTHLSAAEDLSTVMAEEGRAVGIDALVLYLIDLEQKVLVPVPGPDTGDREPLSVTGTVAGRCFAGSAMIDSETSDGRRLWLPLLDGTERLGVVELGFTGRRGTLSPTLTRVCERFAHFIAILLSSKDAYSDVFKRLRRRRPTTSASELVRELVPPAVLATEDFVIAALLEPAYDIGGDAYDYAINGPVLHLGVLDGVGHGLAAAGLTTFALSVYRRARREGLDLAATYADVDAAIAELHPDVRYVTACLAELDVRSGRLRWINAGHPAPLLLRGGRFVKELGVRRSPPMGLQLAEGAPVVAEEQLEPGDMVLVYTDGLTESRRPDGALFTAERLAEFIEREAAGGQAAPETLRRLREAVVERGAGALHDDATAVLVEWRRGGERALMPETVLPT
jgi:hypothetical protein